MKKQYRNLLILLIGFLLLGFVIHPGINDKGCNIKIQWIDNLKGNFDFRTKWSYPENVFTNRFGQLDCEGLCPDGIELMKDDEGKIYPDSLSRFYQLIDTTHQFHSILCEAWCYEFGGTDFIAARLKNNGKLICTTEPNAATHCSLVLEISNDNCTPIIELNSVTPAGRATYYCKGGFIKIDKHFWEQDILKAEFSFDFKNTEEPNKKMYWKGKIYRTIEK